jgi:hypothetical protein
MTTARAVYTNTNINKFETAYKTNQEMSCELYHDYMNELRDARLKKQPIPLYLFSKRVYRAYRNAWRLIDRKLLTQEEINIMLKLGIYKPTQTELGVRRLNKEERNEKAKIRLKFSEAQKS